MAVADECSRPPVASPLTGNPINRPWFWHDTMIILYYIIYHIMLYYISYYIYTHYIIASLLTGNPINRPYFWHDTMRSVTNLDSDKITWNIQMQQALFWAESRLCLKLRCLQLSLFGVPSSLVVSWFGSQVSKLGTFVVLVTSNR